MIDVILSCVESFESKNRNCKISSFIFIFKKKKKEKRIEKNKFDMYSFDFDQRRKYRHVLAIQKMK